MDGIGWALSAMSAARTRLDVAAANVANGSTDGFKNTSLRGALTPNGVRLMRTTDERSGPLRRTGGDFDLAISGEGTFRVRSHDGRQMYTRYGAFARERSGRVTDGRGQTLMGTGGPVYLPPGASITRDGSIVREGRLLNRISLPPGSSLQRGFLEASNVDAIGQMIDLLNAQRSFESAEKVLAAIDQTRERSATQVAQVRS